MVKAGLARQRAQKTGGVEARAGAEHAALRQSQPQRQLTGDDIAGLVMLMSTPSKPLALTLPRSPGRRGW